MAARPGDSWVLGGSGGLGKVVLFYRVISNLNGTIFGVMVPINSTKQTTY